MIQTAPAKSPARNVTAAKLLVAVSELMIERNSIDVSLSDVAHRSGVNAALVKYHFGNKDGLLLALLERDAAAEIANLQELLAQPISATDKLKLHIAGIINAYFRFPYMNRLIHLLLHQSSPQAADEVSQFFVRPLLDFQRQLLADGVASGEFRPLDPLLFYTSLVGACDHLFYGRNTMSRAVGVGGITNDVRRAYIDHMIVLFLGGILKPPAGVQATQQFRATGYHSEPIR